MCTVTFIARRRGYALGMNRDEKLTRVIGRPPKRSRREGRAVLCPSEPGGGTWIVVNDGGTTLALINWYSVTARVVQTGVSRGEVVNAVSAAISPAAAETILRAMPLLRINPFRLIGIFPATHAVIEWRWNLKQLVRKRHRWTTQQWISSGCDEPAAQRVRGRTFRQMLQQPSAGRTEWLRRLHRSHAPQAGPFSTCMHRAEAATVSYTEVVVSSDRATMRHHGGAPCSKLPSDWQRVQLRPVWLGDAVYGIRR